MYNNILQFSNLLLTVLQTVISFNHHLLVNHLTKSTPNSKEGKFDSIF